MVHGSCLKRFSVLCGSSVAMCFGHSGEVKGFIGDLCLFMTLVR